MLDSSQKQLSNEVENNKWKVLNEGGNFAE